MKILVTIPHFYDAKGNGRYGSTRSGWGLRLASFKQCLRSLHNLKQTSASALNISQRRIEAIPSEEAVHVDIVICTTGKQHLSQHVDLSTLNIEHRPTSAEPMLLGYECHKVLADRLGKYDLFAYMEDDLIIEDPLFLRKLLWFNRTFGDDNLLQPNRFENASSRLHDSKLYIDGDLRPCVTAGFQDVHDRAELTADFLGGPMTFRRPLNPHSGCFVLTARQMELFAAQPFFLNRSTKFVTGLESAATLGVARTFRVYKPADSASDFFEIRHSGTAFIDALRGSRDSSKSGSALHSRGCNDAAAASQASADEPNANCLSRLSDNVRSVIRQARPHRRGRRRSGLVPSMREIQNLETRQLLAATAEFQLFQEQLRVDVDSVNVEIRTDAAGNAIVLDLTNNVLVPIIGTNSQPITLPGADVMRMLVLGGAGNDGVTISTAGLALLNDESVVVRTGSGNDNIVITAETDVRVEAGSGKDLIRFISTNGRIVAFGEAGEDTLEGGSAADTLDGGDGKDVIKGNLGSDSLVGGDGDDSYIFSPVASSSDQDDRINDNAIGQTFLGLPRVNTLDFSSFPGSSPVSIDLSESVITHPFGTIRNSVPQTRVGNAINKVIGTNGDDVFTWTDVAFHTEFIGGAGDDFYLIAGRPEGRVFIGELVSGGRDIIDVSGLVLFSPLGKGADIDLELGRILADNLSVSGLSNVEVVIGTDLNDSFIDQTTPVSNLFVGGGGNDTFDSNGGGNDTFFGGDGIDEVSFTKKRFTDGIQGTLIPDVEGFGSATSQFGLLRFNEVEHLTGSQGPDLLIGNEEDNTLRGAGGDDTLKGGGGNDHLDGGDGNDTYAFVQVPTANEVDTIRETGRLDTQPALADADVLDFSELAPTGGSASPNLDVTLDGDVIARHNGREIRQLRTGRFVGELFASVIGSEFPDSIVGHQSRGVQMNGLGGSDTLIGGDLNDELFGGDDSDILDGRGGRNLISGGKDNDVLIGGPDRDRLIGGSGSDTFIGGGGDDSFLDAVIDVAVIGNSDAKDPICVGEAVEYTVKVQNIGGQDTDAANNVIASSSFVGGAINGVAQAIPLGVEFNHPLTGAPTGVRLIPSGGIETVNPKPVGTGVVPGTGAHSVLATYDIRQTDGDTENNLLKEQTTVVGKKPAPPIPSAPGGKVGNISINANNNSTGSLNERIRIDNARNALADSGIPVFGAADAGLIDNFVAQFPQAAVGDPFGVNVTVDGTPGISSTPELQAESSDPVISADGKFVAFTTNAVNLHPALDKGFENIFVRNMETGEQHFASIGVDGTDGADFAGIDSVPLMLSPDGRFLLFMSNIQNLVDGITDRNGFFGSDLYWRDLQTGTTKLVTVTADGLSNSDFAFGAGQSRNIDMTSDGRFVVFVSRASDVTAGQVGGVRNVYRRDMVNNTTLLITTTTDGNPSNGTGNTASADSPRISSDGNLVFFSSNASNLTNLTDGNSTGAGDFDRVDIFVRDVTAATTTYVSMKTDGTGGGNDSTQGIFDITADATKVVFSSEAQDIDALGNNGSQDEVYIRDLATGATDRISVDFQGGIADGDSISPTISDDGQFVAFASSAADMRATNGSTLRQVYVRDLLNQITTMVSITPNDSPGNSSSSNPVISGSGAIVFFESGASNLTTATDTNGRTDLFISDRHNPQTGGASLLFDAPSGQDNFMILRKVADKIQVIDGNTNAVLKEADATVEFIRINGAANNEDILQIDFSGGTFFPGQGLIFNGGAAGDDSLQFNGDTFAVGEHQVTGPGSGFVLLDHSGGNFGVSYTGLEPVHEVTTAADRIFRIQVTGDVQILVSDGGNNAIRIEPVSPTAFETTTLASPTNSLSVIAGDGNDTVSVTSMPTGIGGTFAGTLIIEGGRGNDVLDASALNVSSPATIVLVDGFGDDILKGHLGDTVFRLTPGSADIIEDAGGSDTVDFSQSLNAVTLDLDLQNTPQSVDGFNTVELRGLIENFIGSAGQDLVNIIGLATAARTLDGGDGFDTAIIDTLGAFFTRTGNVITLAGSQPITLINFEDIQFINSTIGSPLTIDLSENADHASLIDNGDGSFTLFDLNNSFGGDVAFVPPEVGVIVRGLAGDDTYRFDADTPLGLFTLIETTGTDTISLSSTSSTGVFINLGLTGIQVVNANLSLKLNSASRFENAVGGSGDDTLTGNALANRLTGNAGKDRLAGGAGDDVLVGGLNNDVYVFGVAISAEADVVIEAGNTGKDALNFSALTTTVNLSLGTTAIQAVHTNRTLQLNSSGTIENATGGSGSDFLTGNALANRLTGKAGNDRLTGAAGNDVLVGGQDDDVYVFGVATSAEADVVIETGNNGNDTLNFSSLTTAVNLSLGTASIQAVHSNRTLQLNSSGTIENATGGSGNDFLTGNFLPGKLTGNDGNDILVGNKGNDRLLGLGGRDILIGGPGLDVMDGGSNDDILIAGFTASDALISKLNDLRTEWTSATPYETRVDNIRAGVGTSFASLKATANVFDDGGDKDSLTGNQGQDWYFTAIDDVISDLVASELIDLL